LLAELQVLVRAQKVASASAASSLCRLCNPLCIPRVAGAFQRLMLKRGGSTLYHTGQVSLSSILSFGQLQPMSSSGCLTHPRHHVALTQLFQRRLHSPAGKPLVLLGLESSADDSCVSLCLVETTPTHAQRDILCFGPIYHRIQASIVTSDRRILANVVLKQEALLEQYGGIHPLHAQHSHARNIPIAIQQVLREAKLTLKDLDGIAFTRGPGMAGCLQTCAASAKALAAATGLPLIGVHHMQAHALTPFLTEPEPPQFPFLTLLLSGGHTLLLLARSETSFEILATTHDESIG
jgi:N6-L-threonylcarbamoyladenine synthase